MSALLAMIFSVTLMSGCSHSGHNPATPAPAGLLLTTTQISQPVVSEQLDPLPLCPRPNSSTRRAAPRRLAPGATLNRYVPERLIRPSYVNTSQMRR